MEVLDGSARKDNAVVRFIVRLLDYGSFEKFLNALCVPWGDFCLARIRQPTYPRQL